MRCHAVDYAIQGAELQLVEIELDTGETVVAEAGAMTFIEEGIKFNTKMGDGSNSNVFGKLFSMGKRMLGGESLFTTHFTNKGQHKARVGFSAPYPGNIVALNMAELGGKVICQRGAF